VEERQRLARILLVVTLGVWLALPVLLIPYEATDYTPFAVAGDLARMHETDDIYVQDDGTATETFKEVACRYADDPDRCLPFTYVSTPIALPYAVATSHLDPGLASFLLRVACAVAAVATMAILWRQLADRSDDAPMLLALSAVLLTPVVEVAISAGNNTPILVFLAALPMTRTWGRRWDAPIGVLIGVATVLKAFPSALIAVALHWRRYKLATWAVGTVVALIVLTLVVAPASIFGEFIRSSKSWAAELTSVSANASVTSYLTGLAPGLGGLITWGVRAGAVAMGVFLYRRLGEDLLWPCTLPVMLIVWPQVWVAYFLFTFVAVAAVANRSGRLWAIPLAAATTLPGAWAQHSYLHEPVVYVASLAAGWVVLLLALPPRPVEVDAPVEMSEVGAPR
jgi:hypothetical protein